VVDPKVTAAKAAELARIVAPATIAPNFLKFTFMVSRRETGILII